MATPSPARRGTSHWCGGTWAVVWRAASVPPCAVLTACAAGGSQSALAPAGPDALTIFRMHWVLVSLASAVALAVIGATILALVRRREPRGVRPPLPLSPSVPEQRSGPSAPERLAGTEHGAGIGTGDSTIELETGASDRGAVRWILGGGAVFPSVVLVGLFVYVMVVLREVDRPAPAGALTVDVIGRQYWWEIHYYDGHGEHLLETANEIHIPAGTPVRVRLRAADVIHSFWVPRLAGKLDMIPGRTNEFSIEATSPGTYRGQCAEYCGVQHAKMAMLVVAEDTADFQAWLASQAAGAAEPADSIARRGREVFLASDCSTCHAIRGTPADADTGPDLTHVASRLTLAGLAIPNTRGHLGGWLANPQAIKPGANMPAVPLDRSSYDAVLHYLSTLR